MISLRKAFLAISHPTPANTRSRPIITLSKTSKWEIQNISASINCLETSRSLTLTGSSPMKYAVIPIAYHLLK